MAAASSFFLLLEPWRSIDSTKSPAIVRSSETIQQTPNFSEVEMGANHAGERKRQKLKNTKKIIRTQLKKAKAKGA